MGGEGMKLAIGIVLLIVGLWFLWGTIRGKKPRVTFMGASRAHTRGDFVTGSLLTILFVGMGMCFIFGIAWWWIFVVSSIVATAIWLLLYSRWIEKSYLKGSRDIENDELNRP
jgi:predicted small integral membrane protein